jgi:hypothetical protein
MAKNTPFNCQINHSSQVTEFDTHNLFDKDYIESNLSAIDTFLEKTQGLSNLLGKNIKIDDNNEPLLNDNNEPEVHEYFANLMILAYISAVESYLREIIRKIILTDETAKKTSEKQNLTYGAALIHYQDIV